MRARSGWSTSIGRPCLPRRFRREVFAGRKTPLMFGDPEEWIALLLESLKLTALSEIAKGQGLRERAFELAPAERRAREWATVRVAGRCGRPARADARSHHERPLLLDSVPSHRRVADRGAPGSQGSRLVAGSAEVDERRAKPSRCCRRATLVRRVGGFRGFVLRGARNGWTRGRTSISVSVSGSSRPTSTKFR